MPCRVAALIVALCVAPSFAQVDPPDPSFIRTWDGGGTANLWSDNLNWVANVVPTSSIENTLRFDGSLRIVHTNDLANGFRLNILSFLSTANAFNISGNSLDFRANSSGATGQPQILASVPIGNRPQVQNDLAWNANTLFVNGPSGSAVELSGDITGGAGLTLQSSFGGTLILSGGGAYTGATNVNGGTLQVNGIVNNVGLGVTLQAGTTLNGTGELNRPVTAIAATIGSIGLLELGSTLLINASSTITPGAVSVTGLTTVNNGTLTVASGSTLGGAGGVSVLSARTLTANGTVNKAVAVTSGTLNGTGSVSGAVTLTSGTLNSTGTLFLSNTLTHSSGTSQLTTGTVSVGGLTTVSAGEFGILLPALLTGAGNLSVSPGATLRVSGTAQKAVTVTGTAGNPGIVTGGGFVNGSLNVAANARLRPGESPGTIRIGNGITISGTYDWELTGNTDVDGNFDRVRLDGGLGDFGLGGLSVNAPGVNYGNPFWDTTRQWDVVLSNSTTPLVNFGPGALSFETGTPVPNPLTDGAFAFAVLSNVVVPGVGTFNQTIQLRWTPVPEPAGVLLACAVAAGARSWRVIRRRGPAG